MQLIYNVFLPGDLVKVRKVWDKVPFLAAAIYVGGKQRRVFKDFRNTTLLVVQPGEKFAKTYLENVFVLNSRDSTIYELSCSILIKI